MKDIAGTVGVSINTVSRALSYKPGINEKTRQLIIKTAQDVGYEYENGVPSRPQSEKDRTIGLVITDNANPFFAQVVRGVQNLLWQHRYTLILCNTNEDYAQERGAVEMMLERKVAGIILTPTQSKDQDISLIQDSGIPFVLMGRHFSNHKVPNVVIDDKQGAYSAIEHLVRLGHTRILFINAPKYISSAQERYDGYVAALLDNGIQLDDSLIRTSEPNVDAACNEMKSICIEQLQYTAIFTFCDLMMLGVLKVLQERGIEIPKKYSLVSFDDIDFVSLLKPPLTTVHVNKYKMGEDSARMLLSIIRGENLFEQTVIIPTKLIIRGSTVKLGQ